MRLQNQVLLMGGPMDQALVARHSPIVRTPVRWAEIAGHDGRYARPHQADDGFIVSEWEDNDVDGNS